MIRRCRRFFELALLSPTFFAAGCVAHLHHDLAPPIGYERIPPLSANPHFDYESAGAVALSEPFDQTRSHDVVRFTFASSGRNGHPQNIVEGQYFRSRMPGPKKLVVVMPIWGTSTYPPSKISYGYARRSRGEAHVIWIYGTAPLFPWRDLSSVPTEEAFIAMARDSAERYRTAVVDMRRLLDWVATREEIDASRVGFVGFSMSALVTATLLGNDARVKAAVLMMGAANFADVFATCGERAGEVRAHVLESFGWSITRYRDFFAELFDPADPVRYPGRFDPDRILMIDALFDDCMPESSRTALWEVTGHPERITMLSRHRRAFFSLTPLGLNYSRRKIYRFLDRAL
jgi:hypothetical protein